MYERANNHSKLMPASPTTGNYLFKTGEHFISKHIDLYSMWSLGNAVIEI